MAKWHLVFQINPLGIFNFQRKFACKEMSTLFRNNKAASLFGTVVMRTKKHKAGSIETQPNKDQLRTYLSHDYPLHLLKEGPKTKEILLTRNEAIGYYRKMMMVRCIETTAGNMYAESKVRGFCHESIGQEASPVGISSALADGDSVINGYRIHGWSWLMGMSAKEILGELTWRLHGNVHGKGGSMHMYGRNFFGGHGIVGAQIPLGVGLALSKKYKKHPNISVTLYGDGASNQGQFYEAANIAALWNLPAIFVCENNGYGMKTPVKMASASLHMFNRCNFLPGILVDGMDVLAVREAARWARKYCLEGNGPIVLELDTYRFVGHTVGEPGIGYRSQEEINELRKARDPISHFREKIISEQLVHEEDIKAIDKEVKAEIEEASAMAHTDRELPVEGLYTDIYANTPPVWIRGITPKMSITQKYTTSEELMKAIEK